MNMLVDGQHVDSGSWAAQGDVRVFASGSAWVRAYDRTKVMASGESHVDAHDEARVILCDGSHARSGGEDRPTIVAIGLHTAVEADGQARVEIFDGEVVAYRGPRILVHRRARAWAGVGMREARIIADHRASFSPGTISYGRFDPLAHLRWRAP